jgi:hypothetical protein
MELYADLCYCARKVAGIKETVENNLVIEVTIECASLTSKFIFHFFAKNRSRKFLIFFRCYK